MVTCEQRSEGREGGRPKVSAGSESSDYKGPEAGERVLKKKQAQCG